tara:strand:+ start:106 stop:513 length:408 start_codon:yes stop_codon:yes gene_type:complete
MEKYLVFHASGVDSSSLTASDTGADVDLGCFKVSDISAIMGEEDMVYIYFKNAGRFEGGPVGSATEVLEQSFVRLTVGEGKEIDVIKDLTILFNGGPHSTGQILFDAVNSVWPISNVTAIQIRRHLTTHTIASDS